MRLGIGDEAHVVTLDVERNIVYMVANPFANPIKEHSWRLVGRGLVHTLGMREFRDNMGLIFGGNITSHDDIFHSRGRLGICSCGMDRSADQGLPRYYR